jgi:hypothetical protein
MLPFRLQAGIDRVSLTILVQGNNSLSPPADQEALPASVWATRCPHVIRFRENDRGKNAYLATFVDRKTKFLLVKIMPDKTALAPNKATVRAFRPVPQELRNTLTVDNGKEFAAHMAL